MIDSVYLKDAPILGAVDDVCAKLLGFDEFPEELFVIHFPEHKMHLCYNFNHAPGLATFSTEYFAQKWMDQAPSAEGFDIVGDTYDEIVNLAYSKNSIIAIHLLDDPNDIKTRYIKGPND